MRRKFCVCEASEMVDLFLERVERTREETGLRARAQKHGVEKSVMRARGRVMMGTIKKRSWVPGEVRGGRGL